MAGKIKKMHYNQDFEHAFELEKAKLSLKHAFSIQVENR